MAWRVACKRCKGECEVTEQELSHTNTNRPVPAFKWGGAGAGRDATYY